MMRTREKVTKPCPICGVVFTTDASRMKHGRGVHCSRACQYIANREKRSKPKVQFTCIGCGVEFERQPSLSVKNKGAGKFCTRDCRDKHWKGEITPNWQGGSGVYKRGPNWQSVKRAALARDEFVCQDCGIGGQLHVHHIIPFRMFDTHDEANQMENLISLCPPCHRRADAASRWQKVNGTIVETPVFRIAA